MALSPQDLLDLLTRWIKGPDLLAPDEHPRPTLPPESTSMVLERCGAWCGRASMESDKAIARDVAFARWLGLTRLDVIVNDHSASKVARPFDTYDPKKIVALCKAATSAGLEVNLMSWIMPHERYLDEGLPVLLSLLETTDAASIMFDAEEPWTQARRPLPYDQAASIVAKALGSHRWGVTGIGYASTEKLGPLVRASSYMVPQAYVTSSSGLDPNHAPYDLSQRWKKSFGIRDLVVGLAAYKQSGIPGHTIDQAIRSAFTSASSAKPIAISWWSLGQIRSDKKVAASIKDLLEHVNARLMVSPPTPQENA